MPENGAQIMRAEDMSAWGDARRAQGVGGYAGVLPWAAIALGNGRVASVDRFSDSCTAFLSLDGPWAAGRPVDWTAIT